MHHASITPEVNKHERRMGNAVFGLPQSLPKAFKKCYQLNLEPFMYPTNAKAPYISTNARF